MGGGGPGGAGPRVLVIRLWGFGKAGCLPGHGPESWALDKGARPSGPGAEGGAEARELGVGGE